jgi:hypothetical protein
MFEEQGNNSTSLFGRLPTDVLSLIVMELDDDSKKTFRHASKHARALVDRFWQPLAGSNVHEFCCICATRDEYLYCRLVGATPGMHMPSEPRGS